MPTRNKKSRSFWKIVAFDAAAGLCFIGVILFGWLPGPGGVPLFILGLSLLAANHDWAERWLETAKHKGMSIKQWLFPENPLIRLCYDLLSLVLVGGGIYLLLHTQKRWQEGLFVIAICVGLFIFLLNRERFDKLSDLFKKKLPNKTKK